MLTFTDQTKYTIQLKNTPKRIISIVPSQSELLWDLGLKNKLVGITKFCIHPNKMFKNVERVGGTKNLNIEKIRKLKPDLIIGNKEENSKEQIELLRKEFNVWMSDIYTLEDSLDMMHELGKITGKKNAANKISAKVVKAISKTKNTFKNKKVIYLIWNKPYMLAGKNTFIHTMLKHLGFVNCVGNLERYPELSTEEIKKLKPDYCFLSSEPYPFKEKHVGEFEKLIPNSKTIIVDGEMFSWYGSRLAQLPKYIIKLEKLVLSGR